MPTETFDSILRIGHKGNAVEVPFDPGERWSVGSRPLWAGRRGFPVRATLNGTPFESAIVRRSRKFWLLVPIEVSERAAIAVGQSGAFSVTPDVPPERTREKPGAA